MSWGSIISTGGKILGQLLTNVFSETEAGEGRRRVLSLHMGATGDPNAHFSYNPDSKQIQLFNFSTTPSNIVIAFPGSPKMSPTTAVIQKMQALDLTPAFTQYAGDDCSQFELMSTGMVIDPSKSDIAADNGITIVSTGYNIPVGGADVQVGAYLNVNVDKNSITVSDATLSGIIMAINTLTISGSGDTKIKFTDQSSPLGCKKMTLTLPDEIRCDTVNVGISVQYSNAQKVIAEINDVHIKRGLLKNYSNVECLKLLENALRV